MNAVLEVSKPSLKKDWEVCLLKLSKLHTCTGYISDITHLERNLFDRSHCSLHALTTKGCPKL